MRGGGGEGSKKRRVRKKGHERMGRHSERKHKKNSYASKKKRDKIRALVPDVHSKKKREGNPPSTSFSSFANAL